MVKRPLTSEPWRVGVLFSQTGVTGIIERSQLNGTLLAIDEINAAGGINDRELVPIICDPQSDDLNFAKLSDKLFTEDGVTMIFGCYRSSSRKAVLPIVERRNGLLWYPTLYEGFEYSPNIIYTGAAPNQNSIELARFLMETYGTRFYFVGSNYVYPRESNRIMRSLVEQNGGEVVGEVYVDILARRQHFKPVIRDIKRTQPDVIFSTVVGDGTVYFYQAYHDAGFSSRVMPISSLTTSEAEIRAMGPDVGDGPITAAPYFETVESVRNRDVVAQSKKRFGDQEPTNMCVEAAYFQIHIFAKALAEVNEMETDFLRPMVLGSELEAPQGFVSIGEDYNHTNLFSRIGKVGRDGRFSILRESVAPVLADPYLVNYACGCPKAFH